MGEIVKQMSLWGEMYETKRITKDIRMVEFFAGIGSQFAAMKEVVRHHPSIKVESYKICEWAYNSYCAYNDIHIKDKTDYSVGMSKEELINKVNGTSINYNEPLTIEQLNKRPIEWLRNAYNNIKATHNLVNICNVKGKDLEIVDTDKYEYVVSWSFPCQDLSTAGLRKGCKDTTTRSGLCHEFLRIIGECENKPQCLLMENVPDLVGTTFVKDFQLLEQKLSELGYTNYVEILNAKHYGIPQNRKRVFMISLLGDYAYDFPCKLKLKYKLKDLLESKVDEKYYLSEKMINCFMSDGTGDYPRGERFKQNLYRKNQDIGNSITTLAGNRATDNFIVDDINNKAVKETIEQNEINDGDFIDAYNRNVKSDIAGTITTRVNASNETFVAQKIALKRGYDCEVKEEQENSNGVDIIGNYSKSNFVQTSIVGKNGIAPTITENHGQTTAIVEKEETFTETEKQLFTKDGNIKRYLGSEQVDEFKEGQMATTTFPNGYGHGPRTHNESIALNTIDRPVIKYNLRIRKLTPKECGRLMGFTDNDIGAIQLTDSGQYHVFGDSIVVSVLISIFSQLVFGNDKHIEIVNEYVERIKNNE